MSLMRSVRLPGYKSQREEAQVVLYQVAFKEVAVLSVRAEVSKHGRTRAFALLHLRANGLEGNLHESHRTQEVHSGPH
jgi:hypothetical protein